MKNTAIRFYQDILANKNRNGVLPRDDYKELAETSLILLGQKPPGGVSYKKPGASHKARFMANGIYANKMFLFQKDLGYDRETVTALQRFVQFNALIYTPYFLKSSVGADAPYNDLNLFISLFGYKKIDKSLAEVVLTVLQRHCWYLTEQTVVFSLFSNRLNRDQKSRIAAKLLTQNPSEKFGSGPPKFPVMTEKTKLENLLGPNSFMLFNNLNTDYKWLETDPSGWGDDPDYLQLEEFVRTLKVTNDTAERGVKMITEYATILTTDEEQRQ